MNGQTRHPELNERGKRQRSTSVGKKFYVAVPREIWEPQDSGDSDERTSTAHQHPIVLGEGVIRARMPC